MHGAQVKAAVGGDPRGVLIPPEGGFWVTSDTAIKRLLAVERFPGIVWEPACGNGAISKLLWNCSEIRQVISSDLYDRGYGHTGIDFLTVNCLPVDHIITNPPFDLAEKFAHRAVKLARGKVALFARLAWLEGQTRHRTLWLTRPPARIWVFPDRVPLGRNGGPEQTGLIAFAWYVWDTAFIGFSVVRLASKVVRPFQPSARVLRVSVTQSIDVLY